MKCVRIAVIMLRRLWITLGRRWVSRDRIVRLEEVGLGVRCKFYSLQLTTCTYVRILGSWANHCEHEIMIPSTTKRYWVTSGCWLMIDGLFVVVTRPRCILSFRLLRAANLWWYEVNDRRSIQYNRMLFNEYALRPGLITWWKVW